MSENYSSKNWDALPGGLIVPKGTSGSQKREVRRSYDTAPKKMPKKKTVDIPAPALEAMNIEIDRLVDRYLGETTDFQNVIKLEDALYDLGQEYGVTIVLSVLERNGEPYVVIDTEEILNSVADDTPDAKLHQMFVDKAHGAGVKVKSDVDVLFDPKASQEDIMKFLGPKKKR